MKIVDAKVFVCCPGRNFVTLKLTTESGFTGLGDATLNGRELAVASYLGEHVCPLLIGRDAGQIEDIWQYLYKGAYWRRGPVTMNAIGAVDVALWDIKGKAAGMPVYQLLGGKARDGVLVYGHANGDDITSALRAVESFLEHGYLAVRAQALVPGLEKMYGITKEQFRYEAAEGELPLETVWETRPYLEFVPKLMQAVREQLGYEFHLLHDVHHRLTPIEAAELGKRVEEYSLFWLEDPTPAELQESFRIIRGHTTTPIAVGEVFNTIWDCQQLIEEQLIDYIRMDAAHSGGLTHLRKIAALGELHNVRTGCHGATDLSPVCLAADLHFGISVPNFGIQEYMRHSDETDAVFPHAYSFANGYLHPGEEPGLGVELDESLLERFPYKRCYLPVARLRDGSVTSW
ncbi:MAG: D-mannonate dehydratase ManD [Gaiellaceae bacterium]